MSAGTFSAIGDVSASVAIDQDDGLSITLANTGGNLWTVVLEESIGNASWRQMATYSSDQSATVVTPRLGRMLIVRLRAATILTGDTIAYTVTRVSNQDGVTLTLEDGVPIDPTLALTSDIPEPILLRASVSLTNAQIIALPTTGVELVAAPGAGYVAVPVSVSVVLNNAAGVYTADDGSSWLVQWAGGAYIGDPRPIKSRLTSANIYFLELPTIFLKEGTGSGGTFFDNIVIGDTSAQTLATAEDKAIQIKDDWNGVSNYGAGNVANSAEITTYYIKRAV